MPSVQLIGSGTVLYNTVPGAYRGVLAGDLRPSDVFDVSLGVAGFASGSYRLQVSRHNTGVPELDRILNQRAMAKENIECVPISPTRITNTKEFQFADRTWFEDIYGYRSIKADIAKNGLKNNLIEYVEIGGQRYVVRGNGRL